MSSRSFSSVIAIAVTLAAPLAHADNDGFKWIGGEAGFVYAPSSSERSRSEVKQEVQAALRDGTWREQQREKNYLPTEVPTAGFAPSRAQTRQAERLTAPRSSDGWRFVGGEAGWEFVGR